jgi:hypothetical protein
MHPAASSHGVSRSAWAADGLPLEFNHRIGFSSALDGAKTFDPHAKYEVRRKRPLAGRPLNLVWGRFSIGNPYTILRKDDHSTTFCTPLAALVEAGKDSSTGVEIGFTRLIL